MGRLYSAIFTDVAVSVQQDFFEVLAPTDAVVVVHAIELEQNTETGDAAEEALNVVMKRGVGTVTSGSGGSTPTAQPKEDGDVAFGGTVEANNTTKMVVGTGSIDTLASWNWNIRIPFNKIFTPEMRPVISPGNRLTMELAKTPADALTISGTIWLEEIGG